MWVRDSDMYEFVLRKHTFFYDARRQVWILPILQLSHMNDDPFSLANGAWNKSWQKQNIYKTVEPSV